MFDPPPLMELAIQAARYKTHRHHTDQKRGFCQHLILLKILGVGAFD